GLDGIGFLAGPVRSRLVEGPRRADQPALDGGAVEHYLPGGLESVDQAYRALHVRLHQVHRVAARVVQFRTRRVEEAADGGRPEPQIPTGGPQVLQFRLTVDGDALGGQQ